MKVFMSFHRFHWLEKLGYQTLSAAVGRCDQHLTSTHMTLY